MALSDALPAPGVLDMLQLGASLALAAPLLVATGIFVAQGDVVMAGFCAGLALVALYLPTYVLGRVVPSSLVPARVGRLLDRWPFR